MEFLQLIWGTLTLRPYVFIFLIVFLVAGFANMGKQRTLIFLMITWIIAFLSEFSSTRNGFPFGLYHYTGLTQGKELFLFNVPFFDSLSFTFLLYASFNISLLTLAPIRVEKGNVRIVDSFGLRQSKSILFLTMFYMLMIDVVIDPVALRGDRWFLGRIYWYEYPGYYFGVPLSNAGGWAFVGFVSLWIYQKVEKKLYDAGKIINPQWFPFQTLMGSGLYVGILLFMYSICWYIGDKSLLIASIFVFLMPVIFLYLRLRDPRHRASEAEWKKHCEEFRIKYNKLP
jgi:uncharacterized membrane protein